MCPVCSGTLKVIGVRKRGVIESGGTKIKIVIRRFRCRECERIHHELPDRVIPYKRHGADTVEKIIAGKTEEVYCEENTVRKIKAWWAACHLYFESVLASLREKYGMVFSERPAPREIVRAVVNANLWVHTRSAFLSG